MAQLYILNGQIGHLAEQFLLARDFQECLNCSREALTTDPYSTAFNLNRAHALMLLGRADEAKAIYFGYHGTRMISHKLFRDILRDEFAKLTEAGLSHLLMAEVERRFTALKWSARLNASGDVLSHSAFDQPNCHIFRPANDDPFEGSVSV